MRPIDLKVLKKMLDTGEAGFGVGFFLNKDGVVNLLESSIVPKKKKDKEKIKAALAQR